MFLMKLRKKLSYRIVEILKKNQNGKIRQKMSSKWTAFVNE
jgi:hypothetical protein